MIHSQRRPKRIVTTPIFTPGTMNEGSAAFVGEGDGISDMKGLEGPEVVVVGSGVASEVAVPRTPASVASPSSAACEADEALRPPCQLQSNNRLEPAI